MLETDVRATIMEKFNISNGWAYELTRAMIKRYPEIHLRKIEVLNAESSFG
jgi:hypothetical protein